MLILMFFRHFLRAYFRCRALSAASSPDACHLRLRCRRLLSARVSRRLMPMPMPSLSRYHDVFQPRVYARCVVTLSALAARITRRLRDSECAGGEAFIIAVIEERLLLMALRAR